MSEHDLNSNPPGIRISIVGGESTARHARQLMLRSETYDVRSYATRAALLANPDSRDDSCIILDLETDPGNGLDLLRKMRDSGWRGKALLLDELPSEPTLLEAERHGDRVFPRDIADPALLNAISASIDRSWTGWNAVV